jgi:hypothetical protein
MLYTPYTSKTFRNNLLVIVLFFTASLLFSACGPYTFKDVSIPPEVKTIKVNFIENRAPYKNPQLSARITDQLQQKIASLTRRTVVATESADYVISGYISSYNVSTAAISSQQASANRLTVGVSMTLFNALENKSTDYQVSRDFDFSAGLTLAQAEAQLLDDIVKNVTDEIFNRLFSNW